MCMSKKSMMTTKNRIFTINKMTVSITSAKNLLYNGLIVSSYPPLFRMISSALAGSNHRPAANGAGTFGCGICEVLGAAPEAVAVGGLI